MVLGGGEGVRMVAQGPDKRTLERVIGGGRRTDKTVSSAIKIYEKQKRLLWNKYWHWNLKMSISWLRMALLLTFMCVEIRLNWGKYCKYLEHSVSRSSFTNRCTFIKTLITIYIKIRWLLHVSVYDHHQGACKWAWLKLYWYENIQ